MCLPPSFQVRVNDLNYYADRTSAGGPAMTWGMQAVGYIETQRWNLVDSNFNRSFANVQQPFHVWTETPTGGTPNFITGAGGFVQTVLFGYPQLRIRSDGVYAQPILPQFATSVTLRRTWYLQQAFSLRYDSQSTYLTYAGPAEGITAGSVPPLVVTNLHTKAKVPFDASHTTVTLPAGDAFIVHAATDDPLSTSVYLRRDGLPASVRRPQ